MTTQKVFVRAALASAIAMAGISSIVNAEETFTLEEIIVTAQQRVEGLQDVPISVSAVSGEKMNEAGITNLEGMTAYVPNLTMNQTGIGTIVAIRGISSGINQGFEQSVGQYVDGIYYGRAQLARAPMMDMARVEVLRGPQSILFGKNSVAGAISMHTAKPTDEFEGSVTALYEPDHGEQDIRVVLSGPITDTVSGRLAILDRSIDGYYENSTLNRDESAEEESVFRASLQWEASEDLTVNLKVEDGSFDTKGRFLEIIEPDQINPGASYAQALSALTGGAYTLDTTQDFKRDSNGDSGTNDTENVTLSIDYDLGDHTLTLISGYNAYEFDEICDCDFTGASIFTADTTEKFDQYSQEIRLTSPGGETVDYIAGFFYQKSEIDFEDAIRLPMDSLLAAAISPALYGTSSERTFTQDSEVMSVFAQATWNISDATRLTVGGRYTDETKDATRHQYHTDATGTALPEGTSADTLNFLYGLFLLEPYDEISQSRSEGAFTPLVTIQHDVNEDLMVYATYVTGAKAGGFDVRSNAHPDASVNNALNALGGNSPITGVFEYADEEAKSFELGSKLTFADGAAELNAALFYTEFTNLQTSQFDGKLGFNVTNAGEATSQGLELDGRWRVNEGLTLSGSMAYLDFEYDSFPNAQCYFGQTPDSSVDASLCDSSGKTREFTPELQATFTADYVYAVSEGLELRTVMDLVYSDEYFASPTIDPNLIQDSYVKVNARISLGSTDGQWDVALVGKNLTDETVMSFGNQAPTSTTLTGGNATAYYAFHDRPMSVALQGTLRF